MPGRVPKAESAGPIDFSYPLREDKNVKAGNNALQKDRFYEAIGSYNKALSRANSDQNKAAINYNLAIAWFKLAQEQNDPSIKEAYLQKAQKHIFTAFKHHRSPIHPDLPYLAGTIHYSLAELNSNDSSWVMGKQYLEDAKNFFVSVLQKTALDPKQRELHKKAQYNLELTIKALDEFLKKYTNGIKTSKHKEKPKTPDAKKETVHKFNRALYEKTRKELAKTLPKKPPKEVAKAAAKAIEDLPRPKLAEAKPTSLGNVSTDSILSIVDTKKPDEGKKLFGYISPNRYVLLKNGILDQLTRIGVTKSPSLPLDPQGQRKELSFTVTLYANNDKISLLNHLNGEIDDIKFYGPDGKENFPQYTLEKGQSQETTIVLQEKFKGTVVYKIYKTEPEKSAGVGKQYVQPAPFAIEYPADLEAELQKLDQLPIAQKVAGLKSWIQTNLIYDRSEETKTAYLSSLVSTPPVNLALKIRKVMCGVANTVFIAILRSRYKIPARLASGFMVSDGNIRDPFHGWAEVFYDGRWHTEDATQQGYSSDFLAVEQKKEKKREYTAADYYKLRAEVYQSDTSPPRLWEFQRVANGLGRNYLNDAFVVLKEQESIPPNFILLLHTASNNSQLIDFFRYLDKKYRAGRVNLRMVVNSLSDAIDRKSYLFNPNLNLVRKLIAGWSPLILQNMDKLSRSDLITAVAFSQEPAHVKPLWNWIVKNKYWRGIDNLLKFNPAYTEQALNFMLDVMNEDNSSSILDKIFEISGLLYGKPEYRFLEKIAPQFYNKAASWAEQHALLDVLFLAPLEFIKANVDNLINNMKSVSDGFKHQVFYNVAGLETLHPGVEGSFLKLALMAHDKRVLKALANLINKHVRRGSSHFSAFSLSAAINSWDNKRLTLLGEVDAKAACIVLEERINRQLELNNWKLDTDKEISKKSLLLLQRLSLKDKTISRKAAYFSLSTMQQLFFLGIEVQTSKEIAKNLAKLLKKSGAKLEEIMAFVDFSAENFTKMHISSSEFTFWSTLISQLLKMLPSDKQYIPIRKMWDKLKQFPKRLRALLPTISGLNYSYFIRAANGEPERKFYDEKLEYEVRKACKDNFPHFSQGDKMLVASRFLAKLSVNTSREELQRLPLSVFVQKYQQNRDSFYLKELMDGKWEKAKCSPEIIKNLTSFALNGFATDVEKNNFINRVESKFNIKLKISKEEREDISHPIEGFIYP
ncbi:hypothetical protein A2276_01575 [candidate division WOR-1 bacterium RIFOXYA12_FULL_43_27]|uniref:Transglutaminase-like domain-containing protein n=1 Tax=candidate division WOR-1 bacterium RIFOXYC2_FULL_46_14 TaxID=1802587 RepID=A0A1F4U745_UNCSA|nr:MAG: hypothetical protein A2276_01575 [candidate division WOR-1 bacterium RIFOXYA12_FULL_43_27]OGC19584.1 MAG: hypothetical protein A2292_02755 [candidate division WOR-1 bacterium RIFOXYB2_FULL_46_45]OGC30573.1 MAG: hypothetical protein A2232_02755 [candidate division WOR-1 bacterium RIFOXYA2_FULL_46_56]OGC40640.1 MAG: hypothetical protein A2438_06470 [candidate division WOR-1 bacterium RIFOXYC2_FULL_46_14]